ncbi:hypothetical protein Bbelb_208630 [Branchiostoma belcheri]|nr:hypothetical protein Bbelb_208630 [Branchiostoma belcheri]
MLFTNGRHGNTITAGHVVPDRVNRLVCDVNRAAGAPDKGKVILRLAASGPGCLPGTARGGRCNTGKPDRTKTAAPLHQTVTHLSEEGHRPGTDQEYPLDLCQTCHVQCFTAGRD